MSSKITRMLVSNNFHSTRFVLPIISRQGFDVRIKHHIQTDKAGADYTSMSDSEASTTHDVIRPGTTRLTVALPY